MTTNAYDTTTTFQTLQPAGNDSTTSPAFPLIFTNGSIYIEDLTDIAGELYAAFGTILDPEHLSPDARRLWNVAGMIFERYGQQRRSAETREHLRVAYLIALDVLMMSPDALRTAIQRLRDEMPRYDAALAAVAAPVEVSRA